MWGGAQKRCIASTICPVLPSICLGMRMLDRCSKPDASAYIFPHVQEGARDADVDEDEESSSHDPDGFGGGKTWDAGEDGTAKRARRKAASKADVESDASTPEGAFNPGPPFLVGERVACKFEDDAEEWFGRVAEILPAPGGASGYKVEGFRESYTFPGTAMRRVKKAGLSHDVEVVRQRPAGWQEEEITINPDVDKWCDAFADGLSDEDDEETKNLSFDEKMERKVRGSRLFPLFFLQDKEKSPAFLPRPDHPCASFFSLYGIYQVQHELDEIEETPSRVTFPVSLSMLNF